MGREIGECHHHYLLSTIKTLNFFIKSHLIQSNPTCLGTIVIFFHHRCGNLVAPLIPFKLIIRLKSLSILEILSISWQIMQISLLLHHKNGSEQTMYCQCMILCSVVLVPGSNTIFDGQNMRIIFTKTRKCG